MAEEFAVLVSGVLAGGPAGVRSAARLMTRLADAPSRLPELFRAYAEVSGTDGRFPFPRVLVGITGAPGCGKSTLTDALVREFRRRHPSRRVGVVAVDPSSPFTGGAVLGDRVRMMRHATDPMVFVRSLATRGHLGGLALGVKGVIRVMALAGCDTVFIETVGVGQSEVEIASVADLVMIVLAPGQGDSIQLLKAGLMEIGDLLIVNKADRPEAARLHSQVLAMLKLGEREPRAAACLVSAVEPRGVDTLAGDIEAIAGERRDQWHARRLAALTTEAREAVLHEAERQLAARLDEDGVLEAQVARVLEGELSVDEVARELLRLACGHPAGPEAPSSQ